jgi:hypothetical protein
MGAPPRAPQPASPDCGSAERLRVGNAGSALTASARHAGPQLGVTWVAPRHVRGRIARRFMAVNAAPEVVFAGGPKILPPEIDSDPETIRDGQLWISTVNRPSSMPSPPSPRREPKNSRPPERHAVWVRGANGPTRPGSGPDSSGRRRGRSRARRTNPPAVPGTVIIFARFPSRRRAAAAQGPLPPSLQPMVARIGIVP